MKSTPNTILEGYKMETNLTTDQKEQALRDNGFFVGGLTDKQIEYYYQKMFSEVAE